MRAILRSGAPPASGEQAELPDDVIAHGILRHAIALHHEIRVFAIQPGPFLEQIVETLVRPLRDAASDKAVAGGLFALGMVLPGGGYSKLDDAADAAKRFSDEKQALVDMAKSDKRRGITEAEMQAYKDLNAGLPDPFPPNKVRGPEAHSSGSPTSRSPHGHVGPVDHIPIKD